jgi:hypothetical protein
LDSTKTHTIEFVKKTEGCCGAGTFIFEVFTIDTGGTPLIVSSHVVPQSL